MDPIARWKHLCGALPGGPSSYTYIQEHCRRKNVMPDQKREIERLQKDVDELARLIPQVEAVVQERTRVRLAATVTPWNPRSPLTPQRVEAHLKALAQKDQKQFSMLQKVPEMIAQLHHALVALPMTESVEARFQRLHIPRTFQSERASIALGVFRALDTTRRQQLLDHGVVTPLPKRT